MYSWEVLYLAYSQSHLGGINLSLIVLFVKSLAASNNSTTYSIPKANFFWSNTQMISLDIIPWNIAHQIQCLVFLSHIIIFVNEKFLINFVLLGGKVVVPENAEENKAVAHLASKFNQSCCADEQGGKTIWIGIKPDTSGQWKVSWLQWKLTSNYFVLDLMEIQGVQVHFSN